MFTLRVFESTYCSSKALEFHNPNLLPDFACFRVLCIVPAARVHSTCCSKYLLICWSTCLASALNAGDAPSGYFATEHMIKCAVTYSLGSQVLQQYTHTLASCYAVLADICVSTPPLFMQLGQSSSWVTPRIYHCIVPAYLVDSSWSYQMTCRVSRTDFLGN